MEPISLVKAAVVVLIGCWWSQLGRSKEIGLILPKKALYYLKSPHFDAPFSLLCKEAVVVLCCGSNRVSSDTRIVCWEGVSNTPSSLPSLHWGGGRKSQALSPPCTEEEGSSRQHSPALTPPCTEEVGGNLQHLPALPALRAAELVLLVSFLNPCPGVHHLSFTRELHSTLQQGLLVITYN